MVDDNTSLYRTAFTISIDARDGVTTGISAGDRAKTILTCVDDNARPDDLVRPGHIFPLRARDGGVLVRAGQTEGSVDLARLAGSSQPASYAR
jgi:3,4-dihydroxy 2-butanone 4-phosphate synthase/GTP cyclohydrolase II